jgi:hypothetical protein
MAAPKRMQSSPAPGSVGVGPPGRVLPFRGMEPQRTYINENEEIARERAGMDAIAAFRRLHPETSGDPVQGLDRRSGSPGRSPLMPASRAVSPLEWAIAEAERTILSLKDDWDEAGAVGYAAETWARAVRFLRTNAVEATRLRREMPVPRILPGPSGSIDLHWRLTHFEMLVNIPADPTASVRFFGDDRAKSAVKGTIGDRGQAAVRLLPWLLWPQ